jgi:hypothetical protein
MSKCPLAVIALLLSTGTTSAHTQTNEITLSCNGTSKVDDHEHPLGNGRRVINLSNNTIASFGVLSKIDRIDDAIISFQGTRTFDSKGENATLYTSVTGQIDRITGKTDIMIYDYGYKYTDISPPIERSSSSHLDLICAPTK